MKKYIVLLALLATASSFAQGTLITAPETSEPDSLLIYTPQKRAAHIPYTDFEAKLRASFDTVYLLNETDPLSVKLEGNQTVNGIKTFTGNHHVATGAEGNFFRIGGGLTNGSITYTVAGGGVTVSGSPISFSNSPVSFQNSIKMGNYPNSKLISYNNRPVFFVREINEAEFGNRIGVLNIGETIPVGGTSAFNVTAKVKRTIHDTIPGKVNLIGTRISQTFDSTRDLMTLEGMRLSPTFNKNGFTYENIYGYNYQVEESAADNHYSFRSNVGKVKFGEYGSGNVTGTATYGAAFDATGKLIEIPLDSIGGGGGSDDQTASEVPFTPYSTIAATNVQDAIEEVLDEIPTSLAAANITVSPAIGGNTDAYAVMDDHEDRIAALEESVTDLTPTEVTYNANLSFAYSASTPNRYVNLTGGISSISITGLNEGDGGILELIRGSGSANSSINFEGMVKPYFFPRGEGASILLSYIQAQNGLQIYCNNCLDVETINIPIVGFDLTTALTTGTNKGMYVIPYDVSIYDVIATNFTAGTTSGTTIDINADGETIFTTPLTIDATENSSLDATTPYVLETTFLPKGTILTVDNTAVPTSANGQSVQILVYKDFEETITPPEEEIVLRINAGGDSYVVATDGFIDWEANSTGTGTNHTSTGGSVTATTSTTWTIHSSASATGVPSADLQLLFDSTRSTNASQSYQATLSNGNYEVILFMGEILGTNDVVVDVTIEGVLEDDGFPILGTFGEDYIGARVYNVTVADGQLNINIAKVSGSNSAKVAAIQVKKI